MLNCKEVTRRLASGEWEEASWSQRLAIRFHLLMCRYCRRYAAQLRAIRATARNLWGPGSEDSDTLDRLESQILGRLPESPGDSMGSSQSQGDKSDK